MVLIFYFTSKFIIHFFHFSFNHYSPLPLFAVLQVIRYLKYWAMISYLFSYLYCSLITIMIRCTLQIVHLSSTYLPASSLPVLCSNNDNNDQVYFANCSSVIYLPVYLPACLYSLPVSVHSSIYPRQRKSGQTRSWLVYTPIYSHYSNVL